MAEAGVGHCDVNSIRGEGANLTGLFAPTAVPKPVAEVQKVLARLAMPIRPVAVQKDLATPEALAATAIVAELEGVVVPAGPIISAMLPSAETLAKFVLPSKARRGDPDADSDEERGARLGGAVVSGEDLGLTRGGRRGGGARGGKAR